MRERGLLLRCARTYNGITVTTAAKEEITSAPLPVLLETRVRGLAPKNTTAIRPESSLSSTLRWGSWQVYDGTAVDRLVGLDYFGARYFGSAQGRFTSPDSPFVGQSPNNPQSWNLYSYGLNNPLRYNDPTGHDPFDPADPSDNGFDCGKNMKDCGPTIGPLPTTSGLGQTKDRALGAVKGLFSGLLDTAEMMGAPSANVNAIKDFFNLWPTSKNQDFGIEVGGFIAMVLPSGEAGEVAKGARTWQEAGITAAEALRIQNAADKTGQTIVLVGSRAAGTAGVASDWDYILNGASSARHAAESSLPRGTAGGAIRGTAESGIDIFQNYNSSAPNFTNLNPSLPHVVFTPKK
jgi:RHS repeat-associated protein